MANSQYQSLRASCVAAYQEVALLLRSDLATLQASNPHISWEQRNLALGKLQSRGVEMVRRMIAAAHDIIAKHKTLGLNPDGWPGFLGGEARRGFDELERVLRDRFDPNGPLNPHRTGEEVRRHQDEVNSFQQDFWDIEKELTTMAQAALEGASREAKQREESLVTKDASSSCLEPGKTYRLAIVSFDYAGSTSLKERVGEEAAKPLLRDWQDHMLGIMKYYGAERLGLGGDGGLLVFEGPQRVETAMVASLHALFYPVARLVRPIIDGEASKVRVILHHAALQWEADTGRMNARDIDLVSKLDKEAGRANAIVATDAFFRECPERIRRGFSPIGEAREMKVYQATLESFASSSNPVQLAPVATERQGADHPIVLVREAICFDSGTVNDYVALSRLTLENISDKDVWRVRLCVTYLDRDGEVGRKFFTLGNASAGTTILPARTSRSWHAIRKVVKRSGTLPLQLSTKLTELSGKATSVRVTVVEVKTSD